MKTKDIVTVTSVALASATLTVVFWSGSLGAGNDGDSLTAKIAKPKLVSRGVEMTVAAVDGREFKAGDEPVLELAAVNTTAEPATVAIHIAMTASSPADRLSRAIRLPAVLWQQQQILVLSPKETKRAAFSTGTKLPAGQLISVSMQTVDPLKQAAPAANPQIRALLPATSSSPLGIVALTFSTITPQTQPALASAR